MAKTVKSNARVISRGPLCRVDSPEGTARIKLSAGHTAPRPARRVSSWSESLRVPCQELALKLHARAAYVILATHHYMAASVTAQVHMPRIQSAIRLATVHTSFRVHRDVIYQDTRFTQNVRRRAFFRKLLPMFQCVLETKR